MLSEEEITHGGMKERKVEIKGFLHFLLYVSFISQITLVSGRVVEEIVLNSFIASFNCSKKGKNLTTL